MYDLTNQGVKLLNMPVIKNDLNAHETVRIHHYICNQPLTATMTRFLAQDQTFTPLTSSEGEMIGRMRRAIPRHTTFIGFSLTGSISFPFEEVSSFPLQRMILSHSSDDYGRLSIER